MDNASFGHQASLSSSRLYRPIAKRGKGFAYAPLGKIAVRTEKLTYSISRIIQQRAGKLSPDDAVPASFREHKHSSRICMLAIAAQSEAAEAAKSRIKSIYVKHETRSKAWRRPVFLGRSQSPRHANSLQRQLDQLSQLENLQIHPSRKTFWGRQQRNIDMD